MIAKQKELEKLQYYIMPGKCPPNFSHLNLYNRAYLYWKKFWNQVFMDNKCDSVLNFEDFPRQDYFGLLVDDGKIVAMQLYCLFDRSQEPTMDHPYIVRSFNKQFHDHLDSHSAQLLMSMEYLTIDPDWRKRQIGLSLGAVLIGLAKRIQHKLDVDALVAPSRADVKVNELVNMNGGVSVVENVIQHNTPVDLSAIYKSSKHENLCEVSKYLISKYWIERQDFGLFNDVEEVKRNSPAFLEVA